jgi:hypothetical protein
MREVAQTIERIDADALLNTPTADLVADLVDEHVPEHIAIFEDRMEQLPVGETQIDVSQDPMRAVFDRSRPALVPGSLVTVVVPFEGHPALFSMQPGQRFVGNAPQGRIQGQEIVLSFSAIEPSAEQVKTFFERQLSMIRQLVGWVNNDIDAFAAKVPHEAEAQIERRKSRLRADRGLEGALDLPVRRRGDAPRTVPVVRKRLGMQRTKTQLPGKKHEDEYALDQAHYEEIVDIALSMARAFERSPTTFVKLDEEQLRDHILLQLNGTFEGSAGGEMFNGEGKTDILVRVRDRNVFIAECKIWHGEKRFSDAIDQLLGYLVWRDTKAALVLFIREKDASAIIEKADQAIRTHPNFKREGRSSSDSTSRRNFILHQAGDDAREIHVALLPVVLREQSQEA